MLPPKNGRFARIVLCEGLFFQSDRPITSLSLSNAVMSVMSVTVRLHLTDIMALYKFNFTLYYATNVVPHRSTQNFAMCLTTKI